MTATRTKRILSVQPVSDGGGSEHALIRMIRQLVADGWECHVVLPGPARLAREYAAAGAVVHVTPMERLSTSGGLGHQLRYAARWPAALRSLVRLGRQVDPAVIHSNSLHSWYGWAAAKALRVPHVWHAREIVFQSGPALWVERLMARRFAARVIAVSEAVAAQLDPGNVVVLTDEADPDQFSPHRAGRFRVGAGIADRIPLVGSVARLDTWKGLDVLLDAFPHARAARPDLELVIAGAAVAGKEDYAAALQSRAAALTGVHWLGPRSDVAEVMADLDVFVQVSTEPEPFGLVVVEALACGVPVIAGAAGGPLEILGRAAVEGPTTAGRLVRPGDARALAEAIVEALPDGPSSSESRRRRRPLRDPTGGQFAALFDEVASSWVASSWVANNRAVSGWRPRPGTGRSGLPRPPRR